MRLLVVGAGVAGAATALAGRRAGMEVVLLERRGALDPDEGSWITLAPNGLDVLEHLGVLDAARRVGWAAHTNRLLGSAGRVLGEVPLGTPLGDGSVALTMKRSALSGLLVDAAIAAGADLRLGATVERVRDGGDAPAAAVLADGSEHRADVVVGADGVWSRVRRAVDPMAPTPRFVGMVNFGGITERTPWAEWLAPAAWHFVFGRRCFTGAFPLSDGRVVWFLNEPRPQVTPEERAARSDAQWRAHLAGLASADVGPAVGLIERGRLELVGDNTHDLAHLPRWHGRSVVLVGDAVHAPSPSAGQGAALALEDAAVLVGLLRDRGPDGMAAYEAARRRRVEAVVRGAARTTSAKMPGPVGRVVRDGFLRALAGSGVMARDVLGTTAHRLGDDVVGVVSRGGRG